MTDTAALPETRLWTPAGFRTDDWIHAEEFAAAGTNGRVILPLNAFLEIPADQRLRDRDRIGVELGPGDPLDRIVGYLDQLSLVALSFPAFTDGRSYSKAELLRSRYGFAGPLRAVGQVLVDQLPLMLRVGFDEFEISSPVLIARLEQGQVGGISEHYQPAVAQETKAGGYAWRRVGE